MNILCLHGCRQTGDIFRKLLKFFTRDTIHNYFFVDAPYEHSEKGKMWFKRELLISEIGIITHDLVGIDNTIMQINNVITQNNINMLLGFSQGANIVDTYLQLTNDKRIKKAILISGYSFPNIKRTFDIPVIIVNSTVDDIVNPKYTPVYPNSTKYIHDKGHKIPFTKTFIKQLDL